MTEDQILKMLQSPEFNKYPPAVQQQMIAAARAEGAGGPAPAPAAAAPEASPSDSPYPTTPTTMTGGVLSTASKGAIPAGVRAANMKRREEAMRIIRLLDDMDDLFKKRIGPKLQGGQISSFGQGTSYVFPTYAGQPDPDVETFFERAGNLSTALNSYYASQGGTGGRPGVGSYETIVKPHIPTPPGGMLDLTGHPFEGRQWNLQQQGDWLPIIKKQVMIDEGLAPPGGYAPLTAGEAGGAGGEDPVAAALRAHGVGPK